MNEASSSRYIGQDELVARVSISPNSIRKLEKQGRFPKRKKLSARAVRWWLPDVEAWLSNPEGWQAPPQ